ncbi:MAG: 16S rRNA (guanine(966)-N(2))-methyltransferase RsmD [Oscillospiraceae bacterium]|nr:16S rRNA (guanine(966)-N(2))-methyltransferase RsmD [Oscillospiraceae bacterium]
MRVIAGEARGRRLVEPKDMSVRPTTDMVKEAAFSILQFDLAGRRVLDLFAGTGQLGIEALSRGAAECVFVDSSPASLALVRKNLALCHMQAAVIQRNALDYLADCGKFDVILLDPPYHQGLYHSVLSAIFRFDILTDGGIILVESMRNEPMPEAVPPYTLAKAYHYGKISLTTYKKNINI